MKKPIVKKGNGESSHPDQNKGRLPGRAIEQIALKLSARPSKR